MVFSSEADPSRHASEIPSNDEDLAPNGALVSSPSPDPAKSILRSPSMDKVEKENRALQRRVTISSETVGSNNGSPPSPKSHHFVETNFNKPTFCQFCNGFIWGFSRQGFQCTSCKYAVHHKCLESVPQRGCGDQLRRPTREQLRQLNEAEGQHRDRENEMENPFMFFSPRNETEELQMEAEVEAKILTDLQNKHARPAAQKIFNLGDAAAFVGDASQVIVQDQFTECFKSYEERPWNWNVYLFPTWMLGVGIRYGFLFPLRLLALVLGSMLVVPALVFTSLLPRTRGIKEFQLKLIRFYCSVWVMSWSGVVRYHGVQPEKRSNQVFVANHTTVFDICILQQNFCFSVVGQKHPGIIGFFQNYVLGCLDCLWFNRSDSNDRAKMAKKIEEHVQDDAKLPLLLFPEGTCVNNDYCVMFKKGAFEIGATVYPIAIKYNKLFSDMFWNSREQSFPRHVLNLLTSWAVVANVWYLPPQTIRPGESGAAFSARVKAMIAEKAGLINVEWDGYYKYFRPSERFVDERRRLFAATLINRASCYDLQGLERSFMELERQQERRLSSESIEPKQLGQLRKFRRALTAPSMSVTSAH
eukprot:TRINITY_DN349_c3_g1_i2.p1 TRINITY_DN349_c3_g1~~TRINITY_DN349_c3_g1_i2.p1  ORF type:complete len:587 (+),score=180.21 TRINITY_DN349_c3_g1_i2:105-1865(+)